MGECLLGLIHTGCDVGRANCNFCQFSPHYTPTTLGSKKNVTGAKRHSTKRVVPLRD